MNKEDKLLIKTLRIIHDQILEERTDISKTDDVNNQIAADYDEMLEHLNKLIPSINEVFDIYKLEEEDFTFIIELIEMYADNFIIDGRTPEAKKQTEKEFLALQSFLDQFYDDEIDDESRFDE